MNRKIATVVGVSLVNGLLWAVDPGGYPGFVKAKFIGSSFDSTGDVFANSIGITNYPDEMYASSCPKLTTWAWAGYMKMTEGVIYNFKGCYDDFATVKVDGSWVMSAGREYQEVSGSYTPKTTDWYKIEFRVGNNGGVGGCQNTTEFGILWNTSENDDWRTVMDPGDGSIFKTGELSAEKLRVTKAMPLIVSTSIRENDPTIMDVTYMVLSPNDTVNVRALAFQDGERSFYKVVIPKSFVKDPDGNETAENIGIVAANVPHNLAWKVMNDWSIDFAKVKFEILTSEQAQLPLKIMKVPATAKYPELTVAYNTQTDEDIFNAFLWYYAGEDPYMVNTDGYIDNTNGVRLVKRTSINGDQRMEILRWMYDKMGWEPVYGGSLLRLIRYATRKDLWFNSATQNCYILKGTFPETLYAGEKAYCVIDLSAGAEAESYPISYLDTEPLAGWSDEYKTTKLILRKIKPGEFSMQNNKSVTLMKGYYIGVYPVTKKQYDLVMGTENATGENDMEPMVISWNEARGDSTTYNWPTVKTVDETKFIGKIRAKTGLNIDLPTEAQWEYAARAGTSSSYGNGGGGDTDRDLFSSSEVTVYAVGMYMSSLWGLYDISGNVSEWCLDWNGTWSKDAEIDYIGADSGTEKIVRGLGCYYPWEPYYTSVYQRNATSPADSGSNMGHFRWCDCGIRILILLNE